MRIVILAGYAKSLVTFRGDLMAAMVSAGHDVHAGAPAIDEIRFNQAVAGKITCHELPLQRTGINPFQDLRYCFAVSRLVRRLKPDIVFAYTMKPVVWGGIAMRFHGRGKFYALITGLGFAFTTTAGKTITRILSYRVITKLMRHALARASAVFFQNPDDENQFLGMGLVANAKTVVVPGSGINLERFREAPMPKGKDVRFLLLSRLIRDKGIYEYIDAAVELSDRYPSAKFKLGGQIDENPTAIDRKDLKRWISSGLIDYYGFLDDVRPALRDCSVFVLPTYYREGIPRTILEALAIGRPIITTDAPGCRETVVDGKNGFLVEPRSVPALVWAMEQFLIKPEIVWRMGNESRRLAKLKFDVSLVNEILLRKMNLI